MVNTALFSSHEVESNVYVRPTRDPALGTILCLAIFCNGTVFNLQSTISSLSMLLINNWSIKLHGARLFDNYVQDFIRFEFASYYY